MRKNLLTIKKMRKDAIAAREMRKKMITTSITERWEADIQSYRDGAEVLVAFPQCETCVNYIKGNALHCRYYENDEKPKYVFSIKKECPAYENNNPIELKVQNNRENRTYGGLFGFCVGDALGVPVEFSTREEREEDPVREMRAYGTYHQPFGTWSDDTSLTICLVDAINKGYSIQRVAENFVNFFKKSYFTPYGEVFDIGNATRYALTKICAGINPIDCGGKTETDNGNGALMRILPIAFYGKKLNEQELVKLTEDVSSITHGHKRSKLACIIYVEFAIWLIEGYKKEEALDRAISFIKSNCFETYGDEFHHFEKILNGEIVHITKDKIKSTGYVIDTLEAVLWVFFHADGYRDTVLNAINLGGDTDTIAAIAGGIAGIYYGLNDIPEKWVQSIAKKEELYQMFEKFCSVTNY